jgi:hypothetical protein
MKTEKAAREGGQERRPIIDRRSVTKPVTDVKSRGELGSDNPFLAAAFGYAAQGWKVFRLAPGSKVPFAGSRGHLEATKHTEQIMNWWCTTPGANIGLATGEASGLFVLDADSYKDAGRDSLKRLIREHGDLPLTRSVQTPRNGRHYYFRHPPGTTIRDSQEPIAPRVDVRPTGGYVAAPPSIVGGHAYKVIVASPLADPPGWLVDLILTGKERRGGGEVVYSLTPSLSLLGLAD